MCLGFQQNERDRLKITAFDLQLSIASACNCLPDSLTLWYLPRINGSPLEINGSNIPPNALRFVNLHHRVASGERVATAAIYESREQVRASEGARFEVCLRDEKLLKGTFRRGESDGWKLECKCALEREIAGIEVKEAEVCVTVEGHAMMDEKVEVVVRRKRRAKYCFQKLEEIPEQREDDVESEGCCSCCCHDSNIELESDGGGECAVEMEAKLEGVRWAVEVGIWVVCLGFGYFVSTTSSKSSLSRRIL